MRESIKFFITMIVFLFGMIISPVFSINGMQNMQMTISVICTGGGFIYMCWLLYIDMFAFDENKDSKKIGIVCLITSLLGLVGQIILRYFYEVGGSSILSYFLFGFEGDAFTSILIYITILLSSFSSVSIFLWAILSVDTSLHDFERITYSNDIEIDRKLVKHSTERHMIFIFALLSALLGLFANSLFVAFILLGFNIYLLTPNKKFGKITLITSIIAGILSFIFTFNTIDYTYQNIIIVMDILPILFFGLVALIIYLNNRFLIGGFGVYSLTIIGFIAIFSGSYALSNILLNVTFNTSEIIDELMMIFAIALIVILVVNLFFIIKDKYYTMKANVALNIFTYPLIILVLSTTLGTLNPFGTSKQYADEVKYTLTGEYVIYNNIKFAESNLGLIAIELVTEDVEFVVLENFEEKTIYSIAPGFLNGNENIRELTISGGKYFESNCIVDCPNLEKINLSYVAEPTPSCEKDAFLLSDETKFVIKNLENINNYITALSPYTKSFKFESDVYLNYAAGVHVTSFSPEYLDSSGISIEITGNVFGLKKIKYSGNGSKNVGNVEKVFSEDENIFKNGKLKDSSFKIKYSYSGRVCVKAWILTNCDSFGGSGKLTIDNLPYVESISFSGEKNSSIGFSVYLSYNS